MSDVVIGSGPSGIAAATALLDRGRSVILLDGGLALEQGDEARRAALAARNPTDWTETDLAGWQGPTHATPPGQVRRFGSDFAMEAESATFAESGGIALRSSRAAGGLSNLWGSAILPYAPSDLRDWPVTPAELDPHVRAVARILPVSGRKDDLGNLFPLDMDGRSPLPPSPQAAELLRRLGARSGRLAGRGITAGQARQAVAAGCRLCAQCLHGCPWELIWSARYSLRALAGHPRVDYRPGSVAVALEEEEAAIRVLLADGRTIEGDRVFVGAGVLETARLMLASFPGLDSVGLRDSQQAFLPMIHRWSGPRPDRAPAHTLAQIFVELSDPEVSPWLVHGQVYSWNEFYLRDLLMNYGRIPGTAPLLAALSRRMMVAQVFLHSDHSASLRLRRSGDGRLSAKAEANPETGPVMDRALRRFSAAFRECGLVPLRFAARSGAPGASFHVGASFPMARSPSGPESDTLGRPLGLRRIHLVDASSLPAIPATTITFGVMANAHRIATLAPE